VIHCPHCLGIPGAAHSHTVGTTSCECGGLRIENDRSGGLYVSLLLQGNPKTNWAVSYDPSWRVPGSRPTVVLKGGIPWAAGIDVTDDRESFSMEWAESVLSVKDVLDS